MKAQAHTQYKFLDEGKEIIVPSVTTVLGQLAKPALIPWANKLGLQGIDVAKYVDLTAEAGSLAHKMILDFFKNEKTDTSEYSKDIIEKAENAFLSFSPVYCINSTSLNESQALLESSGVSFHI